jgi:hypothetical protein
MNYDLYNIGTNDLALGPEFLRELISRSRFDWISSNLKSSGGDYFTDRYLVRDYDGVRVGFFGLLSTKAPTSYFGRADEFIIQDPQEAAREMVGGLRDKGCHLIIALSSLGVSFDQRMASSVSGIDIIFGGYSRSLMRQPKIIGQTLIVQAGSKGMYLGHLQLALKANSPRQWARSGIPTFSEDSSRLYRWLVRSLNKTISDDKEMVSLLARYKEELKKKNIPEKLREERALSAPAGRAVHIGVNACSTCHLEIFREWATSRHARAYTILKKANQDYNPECLPCHTTGYALSSGFSSPKRTPHLKGVQCESCHGPGNRHRQSGNITASPGETVCLPCHNQEKSPAFNFKPYLERLAGHALPKNRGRP